MEMNSIPESNPDKPQTQRGWCLAAGAGLLGVCCAAGMLFLLVFSVLAPSVQTAFDFRQFDLTQPGGVPHSAAATPGATSSRPSVDVLKPAPFEYPRPKDNSIGDPSAPVKIIEYGDFQCPYCARFWGDAEKSIIRNYVMTGKVYFTYRSFVVIGPESKRAAEAAYCAGDQGQFWQYHDFLFTNQGQENSGAFADVNLTAFGRSLGLDQAKFSQCLTTEKFGSRVDLDVEQAKRDGVYATPSFIVNDQLLAGAQSYGEFSKIIDNLLNATPQDFPEPQGQIGRGREPGERQE